MLSRSPPHIFVFLMLRQTFEGWALCSVTFDVNGHILNAAYAECTLQIRRYSVPVLPASQICLHVDRSRRSLLFVRVGECRRAELVTVSDVVSAATSGSIMVRTRERERGGRGQTRDGHADVASTPLSGQLT